MVQFYLLVVLVGIARCGLLEFNGTFEDYFLYTFQNQLDHSVNPCDDFYRHVCQNKVKTTISEYSKFISKYAVTEGRKIAGKLPLSEIENLYKIVVPQFLSDKHANMSVVEDMYKLSSFLHNLRNTIYIKRFMGNNKIRTISEYEFLQKLVNQLLIITKQELTITNQTSPIYQELGDIGKGLKDKIIDIGLQEDQRFTLLYTKIQKSLDNTFNNHFKVHNTSKISELTVVDRKEEFAKIIQNAIGAIRLAMEDFENLLTSNLELTGLNTFNADNDLMILEQYLLPATITFKAAKYGFLGSVLGHEIMHSFFTDDIIERSELVGETSLCTKRQVRRVNNEFNKDVGYKIAAKSYLEDTADHEGGKIAYKAFLEEFGDSKIDNIASGINITNQQMFFYALAVGQCEPMLSTAKHAYSLGNIRVNGAVSLINGFHETFQCSDDDRMKRISHGENCNLLGNPV